MSSYEKIKIVLTITKVIKLFHIPVTCRRCRSCQLVNSDLSLQVGNRSCITSNYGQNLTWTTDERTSREWSVVR